MNIRRSIACCLLGVGIAGSAQAGVQGTVIFESQDGEAADVRQFTSEGELSKAHKNIQTLTPGLGGLPDVSHPQKVLVLLVGPNYQSNWASLVQDHFEGPGPTSLKSFYEAQSNGRLTFGSFAYFSVPQPGYNGCALNTDQLLARYSEASGDKTIDFDHVFYLGAFDGTKCPLGVGYSAYASLGTVKVSNQFGSYEHTASWFTDQLLTTDYIVNHEFGHQLGWFHSNRSSAQDHAEYADASDVMGTSYSSELKMSALRKWSYGWIDDTRTLRPNEYGNAIEISRRSGPELLMVPLAQSRLKPLQVGRTMLAIAIEDELPNTNGELIPHRRAGLVPRIVSTGLPFSASSLLTDPDWDGAIQQSQDLVFAQPGVYSIPEAGVTIVVDRVSRSSAQIRIFDDQGPSPVAFSLQPNAANTACYHRVFTTTGVAPNAWLTAQTAHDGAREIMKSVASGGNLNYAQFLGSGAISMSASVANADGSYTNYNGLADADASCVELPPILRINQTRLDGVVSRECGLIETAAQNLGSASTTIYATSPTLLWSFAGSGYWNNRGTDNRKIITTYWADGNFPIGTTTVGPAECVNSPVPKLQFKATSISADCKTVTFKLNQSAPGMPQSQVSIQVNVVGASGNENLACTFDGEPAGSGSCSMVFSNSVHLKNFNAIANSPSDSTALQGNFNCKATVR